MIAIRQQRGAALFVGIFLITVVVVFAAVVALTSATQNLSQARAGLAEQAWYAAVACLEEAAQEIVQSNSCPPGCSGVASGFTVTLDCPGPESVTEGGNTYEIYSVGASARHGDLNSAVFVRRSVAAQIVSGDTP